MNSPSGVPLASASCMTDFLPARWLSLQARYFWPSITAGVWMPHCVCTAWWPGWAGLGCGEGGGARRQVRFQAWDLRRGSRVWGEELGCARGWGRGGGAVNGLVG